MPETQTAPLQDRLWNTPAVLDAAVTLMIADHGYGAVLGVIAEKMFEEAEHAKADGVIYYGRHLANVAENVSAAANELAFVGIG